MKTTVKERFTKANMILLAIGSLLPLAALGFMIILLLANTLFTPAYIISLILPVFALLAVWATGLSKIKLGWKITCCCIFVFGFVIFFFTVLSWGEFALIDHYSDDGAISPYTEATEKLETMPTLDEIGDPEKIDYYYYVACAMIFGRESDTLLCTYDEQAYQEQKALLDQTYTFQTEDMEANDYTCSPYAEVDGFTFRVLSFDQYQHLYYPKYMTLIGTNDETNQIVYISYDNSDLDYISSSLAKFIEDDCGWKYVQRRKVYFD